MANAFREKLESKKICFVDCHAHISAKEFSEVKHCVTVAKCRESLVHVFHTLHRIRMRDKYAGFFCSIF